MYELRDKAWREFKRKALDSRPKNFTYSAYVNMEIKDAFEHGWNARAEYDKSGVDKEM